MFDIPSLEAIVASVKSLKLPQRRLAQLAGVSQPAISKMLKGGDLRYSTVRRICQAMSEMMRKEQSRTVGEICAKNLVGAREHEPVRRAVEKMLAGSFDQVPVLKGGSVTGTILHRDLVNALAGGTSLVELMQRPMRQVMSSPLPVVDETETVGVVQLLLLHHQAVLVSIGGRVRGIATWADVLKAK